MPPADNTQVEFDSLNPSMNNPRQLTDREFLIFATIIRDRARIHLPTNKLSLLSNRLRKRVLDLKLEDFNDYLEYIRRPENKPEIDNLLDVISTNETYFYRNEAHWQTLAGFVIPKLIKEAKRPAIKLWSAGCSTGEEAYNMVICLLETMKTVGPFQFEVAATDLSHAVIEQAKEGIYSGRKIDKIPEPVIGRYFNDIGAGRFQVRDDLKKYVTFTQSNLFRDELPANQDVIFCRNVMIYFQRDDQKRLTQKLYDSLRDPGYLFIGHSESLHIFNTKFIHERAGASFLYAKRSGS